MFMPDFSSFSPGKERLRVTGRPLSRTAIPCRPQQIAHLQKPRSSVILLTENSNVQCQSERSVPPRRCICSKPPTDALSPGRRFLTGNPTVSLQRVLPFMNALISLLGWNWIMSRDHIGSQNCHWLAPAHEHPPRARWHPADKLSGRKLRKYLEFRMSFMPVVVLF